MTAERVNTAIALIFLCLSSPAAAAIQLIPVIPGGLTRPLFVGNAGDGSDRLFIGEQAGVIKVLQPGTSTPTVFLDLRSGVRSGGEQGLLSFVFHPLYGNTGRFFVAYTRQPDGAIVLAEFKVSALDANVADPAEQVLLTVPHPTYGNHNGGMLAFGADGYLYVGLGDGGSGNDPPNNAQNINVLLGKILRLDINPPAASLLPYVSPPINPFYGPTAGRDEIFAIGVRNPWRFSVDRATGELWVGDVGQNQWEEVHSPILGGANLGWRVYEGSHCTNNDPQLCNPSQYTMPLFEYSHSNGRCSITGGYVYRGMRSTLPWGTYIYGDYCSGEIMAWTDGMQSVLLDTDLFIASFGEDEQGELYVVAIDGSVSRIAGAPLPCSSTLAPTSQMFDSAGGAGSVGMMTARGCSSAATANVPWLHVMVPVIGQQNIVSDHYRIGYLVDANTSTTARTGTLTIGSATFSVQQSGASMSAAPLEPGPGHEPGNARSRSSRRPSRR